MVSASLAMAHTPSNSRISSPSNTTMTTNSPYPYPAALNISNFISTPNANHGLRLDQPNPNFLHWCRSDRLVRAWITSRLTEETLSLVVDLETSREVWLTLQDTFAHISMEREFPLKQKLSTLSKDSTHSIHDYIRYFKSICDDLSLIGKPLSDQDKVFHLLHGLGPDYNPFTTTMMCPPLPTYQSVLPQLINYDTRISDIPRTITTPDFYANRDTRPQDRKQQHQSAKTRSNRTTFSSKGRGFSPHSQSTSGSSKQTNHSSQVTCQIYNGKNHDALPCQHRYNHAYQPNNLAPALAALTLNDTSDTNEWLPDSGAGAHMTSDKGILCNLHPYTGDKFVAVGNGATLDISHIGQDDREDFDQGDEDGGCLFS
ncbi:gag-polypeptide of LTR copia-type [Sesbania bispinosa]|nr:gag-polypeptide of LTR copia-type [Sesbania bispinosa]